MQSGIFSIIMPHRLHLLLLAAVALPRLASADIFEECNDSNNNNFIASNKSCTHFIYCSGEDSFEGECPEENDYFNGQLAMCEPMLDVDCRTGLPLQTNEVLQIAVTELPVTDVTVTQTVTAASTASQVSTETVTDAALQPTTAISVNSQKVVTLLASECPAADNTHQIVLLAHDKSCTEYFICYHGKPLPMTCAAMLHFNVATAKCDKAEVVNCMVSVSRLQHYSYYNYFFFFLC